MARAASRKQVVVLVIVIFIFSVVLLSGGFPQRNQPPERPMLGRFMVSSPEAQASPNEQCEALDGTLIRDMCYWDSVLEVMLTTFHPEPVLDDSCYQIRDPYLQYMCFRLNFRPHMLDFRSGFDSYPRGAVQVPPEECAGLDEYRLLFCTYFYAARMAKTDLEESKGICALLENDRAAGECLNYVASALAMDIETDTGQKISLLGELCRQVTFPSWRSECYYILADELALFRPVMHLEEIADACEASYDAFDYLCFNHVAWLLPDKNRVEFCSIVEERHKNDCFRGLGESRGKSHYGGVFEEDSEFESAEGCEGVPPEFKDSCLMGWADSIAWAFAGRGVEGAKEGVEKCIEFPPVVKHHCLSFLGQLIGVMSVHDVPGGIEKCNMLPGNYSENCLIALAEAEGVFSEGKIYGRPDS